MSTETSPWRRLDARIIWVDALQTVLALTPTVAAVTVFGMEASLANLWPVLLIAFAGATGAVNDVLRWVKTRYRVTDDYVERRTGLLVRRYRSIHRDRIRSVDATAKLRHRLAGLRLVTIGAGQQTATGEAALSLDAVSRQTADQLRHELLHRRPANQPAGAVPAAPAAHSESQVIARLRWSWTIYNVFNAWAYLMAVGLLWGAYWVGTGLGLDSAGFVAGLLDWDQLGLNWTIAIGLLAVSAFGVVALAFQFVLEHWRFTLARVPVEGGTVLRTTQGLLRTREINRDDHRLRGLQLSEPVLWRWMGMADTDVITTGLQTLSLYPATTILPRGPISVARRVATVVLKADPSPLATQLCRHPRAALRRRLWWAVAGSGAVTGLLGWLAVAFPAVPGWTPLIGLAVLPLALAGAVLAYQALGHRLVGDYLVVRCGLVSRATAALQRRAIIGWRFRQSLLQRRLGLVSVTATTAAGYGYYAALDVASDTGVELADQAVPGLLRPFLAQQEEPGGG